MHAVWLVGELLKQNMRHVAARMSELRRVLAGAALLYLRQGGHCQLLLESTARLLFTQQGLLAALQDPATYSVVLGSEPATINCSLRSCCILSGFCLLQVILPSQAASGPQQASTLIAESFPSHPVSL